jgi:hypothetical protein
MAHEGHSQHSGLVWALRPILAWIFLVACGWSHPLQTRSWGHPGLAAKVRTGQLQPAGEHSLSPLTLRNPTYIFLVRGLRVIEGGQTGLVMTAGFNSPESGCQIRLLCSNPKSTLWCSVTLSKSDNLGRVLGKVVPTCNPSTWKVDVGGLRFQGRPTSAIWGAGGQAGLHETLSQNKQLGAGQWLVALILTLRGQTEFQDSQSYTEKPCVKTLNNTYIHTYVHT